MKPNGEWYEIEADTTAARTMRHRFRGFVLYHVLQIWCGKFAPKLIKSMNVKKEKKGRVLEDYDITEILLIGACAILIACYGIAILIAAISTL